MEEKSNEITLNEVNYSGLITILKYIYGGIAYVESDLAVICDTLPLVDMYGLEGLKEVIVCSLKVEKCHLFHKPCSECIPGVFECLEASELFSLAELKNSCIKWIAKHFDRVLSTKGFATLPSTLQEDLLVEIKKNFVISGSIEILNQCDKLSCCTPLVKWTEPIHVAVSSIQESCLLFISNNFLGWSAVLAKEFPLSNRLVARTCNGPLFGTTSTRFGSAKPAQMWNCWMETKACGSLTLTAKLHPPPLRKIISNEGTLKRCPQPQWAKEQANCLQILSSQAL